MLFAKSQSAIDVYNDINDDIVAFFRLFHDPEMFALFQHKCHYTPYSRSLYKENLCHMESANRSYRKDLSLFYHSENVVQWKFWQGRGVF